VTKLLKVKNEQLSEIWRKKKTISKSKIEMEWLPLFGEHRSAYSAENDKV